MVGGFCLIGHWIDRLSGGDGSRRPVRHCSSCCPSNWHWRANSLIEFDSPATVHRGLQSFAWGREHGNRIATPADVAGEAVIGLASRHVFRRRMVLRRLRDLCVAARDSIHYERFAANSKRHWGDHYSLRYCYMLGTLLGGIFEGWRRNPRFKTRAISGRDLKGLHCSPTGQWIKY
jgi:hypothetical protein